MNDNPNANNTLNGSVMPLKAKHGSVQQIFLLLVSHPSTVRELLFHQRCALALHPAAELKFQKFHTSILRTDCNA